MNSSPCNKTGKGFVGLQGIVEEDLQSNAKRRKDNPNTALATIWYVIDEYLPCPYDEGLFPREDRLTRENRKARSLNFDYAVVITAAKSWKEEGTSPNKIQSSKRANINGAIQDLLTR